MLPKLARAKELKDGSTGRTVLRWAAANGCRGMLLQLLSEGVDPNTVDRAGTAPLHSAIINSDTETVAILLGSGTDTDIRNGNGWASLHIAAIIGDRAVTVQQLDHGAHVDAMCTTVVPKTPLHSAVLLGQSVVVQELIVRGVQFGSG